MFVLFSIDQEDTSLNASSEFSVPIILSSDSLHTLEGTDLCSTKQLFEEDTKYCDIENDGDIEMDSTIHDEAGESSMNCIQSNIVQNLKVNIETDITYTELFEIIYENIFF